MTKVEARECKVCHLVKPLTQFSGGKRRTCNLCRSDQEAKRREQVEVKARDRIRSAERRKDEARINYQATYAYKWRLAKMYGMTVADYDALLKAQDGLCKICRKEGRLAVDHCHKTGKVRGLLCLSCNLGIGLMGDDPETVQRAADYLRGEIR